MAKDHASQSMVSADEALQRLIDGMSDSTTESIPRRLGATDLDLAMASLRSRS